MRAVQTIRKLLPQGHGLSASSWRGRHVAILAVLWGHVAALPVFGVVRGYALAHVLLETSVVAAAALVASSSVPGRRVRSGAATFGLLTSSAILTHLSGGTIEMHFHFFVMVPLIALYQDWFPFLLAIAYVLVHHGLIGAIDPGSVFNHPAAIRNPWKWAAIHALFIAGTSIVCLTNWRLNETALARRRRAEDDLRETLSVLTATLEATADGILVVTNDGKIVSFNQRFLEMWRIPESVVASRDDDAALGFVLDQVADPEAFLSKVRQLYDEPEADSHDELVFKDGRVFERYSHPQRIGGQSVGRVWSFRDVTAQKRYEAALEEALRRDRESVKQLRAVDEAKNLFLTAVSHELRTPLSSVVGFAQTLRDRDDVLPPQTRREFLHRLESNAHRLQQLVLNLFDLDRISRGILEPRPQATDMLRLVHGVVEMLDLKEHELVLDVDRVVALIDAGMIERVVENLVANAVKHTPGDTQITLRVVAHEGDVLIAVDDQGPGVADELKDVIFEPFRQGATPAHSPGTGIGLSLVRQFVQLHGGRSWIEDRAGGGASFRVLLPGAAVSASAGVPAFRTA
jgi:signal transduction histidine kinase